MRDFHMLTLPILLFSCEKKISAEEINLSGHWQSLSEGAQELYTEFYFHGDTIERFNIEWELLPFTKYEIREDSLITNIRYKIYIESEQSIYLVSKEDSILLNKLTTNDRTIENLLKEGYFERDLNDSIYRVEINTFIDKSFSLRDLKFKFEKGILNKDSLLAFWNSQLLTDSLNKELYELWIIEFEND